MTETAMHVRSGMSARTARTVENAIIGLCIAALVFVFQPFSKLLSGIGMGLVVLGGLAFNLVPLCEPGRPARSLVKAAVIVVRMDPNTIKIPPSRQDWQIGGILCYSKICTHVGCPISLWEQQTHHLLCPCHQSTFDLGNSGVVVFGPAKRALPQLAIAVDAEGYIIAQRDFTVPVGPSYFERDSRDDYEVGDN